MAERGDILGGGEIMVGLFIIAIILSVLLA
jgi:hypothetical protein